MGVEIWTDSKLNSLLTKIENSNPTEEETYNNNSVFTTAIANYPSKTYTQGDIGLLSQPLSYYDNGVYYISPYKYISLIPMSLIMHNVITAMGCEYIGDTQNIDITDNDFYTNFFTEYTDMPTKFGTGIIKNGKTYITSNIVSNMFEYLYDLGITEGLVTKQPTNTIASSRTLDTGILNSYFNNITSSSNNYISNFVLTASGSALWSGVARLSNVCIFYGIQTARASSCYFMYVPNSKCKFNTDTSGIIRSMNFYNLSGVAYTESEITNLIQVYDMNGDIVTTLPYLEIGDDGTVSTQWDSWSKTYSYRLYFSSTLIYREQAELTIKKEEDLDITSNDIREYTLWYQNKEEYNAYISGRFTNTIFIPLSLNYYATTSSNYGGDSSVTPYDDTGSDDTIIQNDSDISPVVPSNSVIMGGGLVTTYYMSESEFTQFSSNFFTESFIEGLLTIFDTNPMESIIKISSINYPVSSLTAYNTMLIGGKVFPSVSDYFTRRTVANRYAELDCGNITVPHIYNNYLDYTQTQYILYLPYIGEIELDSNAITGHNLHVKYVIDNLTGGCLAYVYVTNTNYSYIIATPSGMCHETVPIARFDKSETIREVGTSITSIAMGITSDNPFASAKGVASLTNVAPHITTGAYPTSSFTQRMNIQTPYLKIIYPNAIYSANRYNYIGQQSNVVMSIGSSSGYTVVNNAQLNNITGARENELEMIREQLQKGIII